MSAVAQIRVAILDRMSRRMLLSRPHGAGRGGRAPVACVMGDMDLIRPLGLAGIPCAAVCARDEPPRFSRFTSATVPRHDAWREQDAQVRDLLEYARRAPVPPIL